MNGPDFIKQHPVLSYYVLTFTISWGALLVAVGFGGLPRNPEQLTKMISCADCGDARGSKCSERFDD
jgi:hypothetical protein